MTGLATRSVKVGGAAALCCALTACVAPTSGSADPVSVAPLRVTNNGQAFRQYEGAAARRVAEAECAGVGRRLRPSIYDRFEAGAWVYVEGCA